MCKVDVNAKVNINAYEVISRSVEDGVSYGIMRAHKHTDKPSEDHIKEEITNAVMNSLSDVLIYNTEEQ